jgi:sugar diacid utilization regulator
MSATDLAAALRASAATRAAEIAHRIHAEVPEFEQRAAVTRQTTEAVRALILAFARKLARDPAEGRVEMPAEAIEYVRAFVHRGFELELLLRVHHLGHRELWSLGVELLDASGGDDCQRQVGAQLFDFMAVLTRRVVEEYETERERWIRSSEALRGEIVRALLAGRPVSVQDSSARLRYDLSANHIALVAWSEESPAVGDGAAVEFARALAGRLRRLAVVVPAGRRTVCAWIALGEDPGGRALELLAGADFAAVSVAIGDPGRGIEGFRASHFDAVAARRVAVLSETRPGTLVRWSEVAALGLLSADLEQARRFASRELGPLDAEDDATARLRSTLAVYLRENDRRRTGERLGIHPNTVAYRLRQCEELLGRPVRERAFELEAALRLRDRAQLTAASGSPSIARASSTLAGRRPDPSVSRLALATSSPLEEAIPPPGR